MQKKHTILFVDDTEHNLILFKETFDNLYRILLASSGDEALSKFKENEISLIISDLRMPNMSGIELLEKARKINPDPPGIIITVHDSVNDLKDAINRSEVFQYILKPWNSKDLGLIIDKAIEKYDLTVKNKKLTEQLKLKNKKLAKELREKEKLIDAITQSQEELNNSRTYLQNILNTAGSIIIVLSPEFKIVEWNQQAEQYFGFTKDEVVYKDFSALFIFDYEQNVEGYLESTIQSEQSQYFEEDIVSSNGLRFSFLWNLSKLSGSNEEVLGLIAIGQNIDELKNAYKERYKSKEQFRTFFDNAVVGYYRISPDGDIILVNKALARMLGYSSVQEFRSINLLNSRIEPFNKRKIFLEQMKDNEQVVDLESVWKRKDNSEVFVSESTRAVKDKHGQVEFFDGIVIDITSRKKAEKKVAENEARYRTLFESSSHAILILKDGVILDCNAKAQELFITKKEEMLGRGLNSPSPSYPPELNKPIKDLYKFSNYTDQVEYKVFEQKYITIQGKVLETEIRLNRAILSSGPVLTANIIDVSDKRLSLRALVESERKFRILAAQSPNMILIISPQKILYANQKCCQVLGYSFQELYEDGFTIQSVVASGQKESIKKYFQSIKGMKGSDSIECRLVAKSRQEIYAIISTQLIQYRDEQVVLCTITDISHQKRTEEIIRENEIKFRAIFENSVDAIALFKKGIHVTVNEAYVKLFRETSIDNIIGKPFVDFIIDKDKPTTEEILSSQYNSKRKQVMFEVYALRADDVTIILEVHLSNYNIGAETYSLAITRDITEKFKAEIALRKSESRLREAQKIAHIGYWTHDHETGKIEWSDEVYKIFGQKKSGFKLTQKAFINLIHPDDRKSVLSSYNDSINNNTKYERTYRIVLPDQNVRFVRDNCRTTYYKSGKPRRSLGTTQDVSDINYALNEIQRLNSQLEKRVKTRTLELEEEKHLSEKIINSIPDIFFAFDEKGSLQHWNKNFQRLLGYTVRELKAIGQLKTIAERDKKMVSEKIAETIEDGAASFEAYLKLKDKSERLYYLSTSKLKYKRKNFLIANGFDLTDRKKAENELRKLSEAVRQSPVIIAITGIDGVIEYVNPKFTEITGYTNKEAIGKKGNLIISEKHGASFYKDLWEVISSGKTWRGEVCNIAKSGKEFWVSESISSIKDEHGDITHFVAVMEDITPRKKIEKELLEAKHEAEQANQAKSEFLANMSHEIRTPMNSILGFTELAHQQTSDEIQKNYLESVKKGGKSLLTIIDDILDLSKIEAGKIKLMYTNTDVRKLIEEVYMLLEPRADAKGIKFYLKFEGELPELVSIDEVRLKQVLFNLISNAIKFTEHGFVRIDVSSSINSKKQNKTVNLKIAISDSGIGIDKRFLNNIFDAFTQQEGQDSKRYGGTGLGLAITERLVSLMKGEVSVESQLNKGSTFRVEFENMKICKKKSNTKTENTSDIGEIKFKPAKILIVDDIADNRKYLVGAFKKTPIETFEATDARNGIELLRKTLPDLIITDIKMPGIDGFEFGKIIKEDTAFKHIPIIATSASVMKRNLKKIEGSVFDDFLAKPIRLDRLYSTVSRFLPTEQFSEDLLDNKANSETSLKAPVIALLQKEVDVQWKELKINQPLDKVSDFADNIKQIGYNHNEKSLVKYAEQISKSVTMFNIDKLLYLLERYPELLRGKGF